VPSDTLALHVSQRPPRLSGPQGTESRQRHPTPRSIVPLSSRRRRAAAVVPTSGFCSPTARCFRSCSRRRIPASTAASTAASSAAARAIYASILLAAAVILTSPLFVSGFSMPVERGGDLASPLGARFCTPFRSQHMFAPFCGLTFTSLFLRSAMSCAALLPFLLSAPHTSINSCFFCGGLSGLSCDLFLSPLVSSGDLDLYPIVAELEVSKRCALPQLACKTLSEIEVSQLWALRQHSCKSFCCFSSHFTAAQFECGQAAPAVIAVSCLKANWRFSFSVPLWVSSQKLLLKQTTAGRRILSTISLTLFDVLLSMIVLPAAQVLHQSSRGKAPRAAAAKSTASNRGWLSRRSLTRGARLLPLRSFSLLSAG
jgi:hypothetical protein